MTDEKNYSDTSKLIKEIKSEAIKEFAERLKSQKEPWLYIHLKEIDKLVKETTEVQECKTK